MQVNKTSGAFSSALRGDANSEYAYFSKLNVLSTIGIA